MSLGHPRILLGPSWRRDVKSPLVALGTYCANYVIDVYSIFVMLLNKNKNPFLVLFYYFLGPKKALFFVVVVFASYKKYGCNQNESNIRNKNKQSK